MVDKELKSNTTYRREFLDELSTFITTINLTGIIIAIDQNESIDSNQMR